MARNFVRANFQRLFSTGFSVSGTNGVTMVARARDTFGAPTVGDMNIGQMQNSASGADYLRLGKSVSTTVYEIACIANDGVTLAEDLLGTYTDGSWFSAGGQWVSSTSRFAWLDGTQGSGNTTSVSVTFGNIQSIAIAREMDSSADDSWEGDIGEVSVYEDVLLSDDMRAHSKGFTADLIWRHALIFYAPLKRGTTANNGTDWDIVGGLTLTGNAGPDEAIIGTVGVAQHPPVRPFKKKRVLKPPAAGAVSAVLTIATEQDVAQAVAPIAPITGQVGQATSQEIAQPITPTANVSGVLAQATEQDLAQAINAIVPVSAVLGLATSQEIAQPMTAISGVVGTLGPATEQDLAQGITPLTAVVAALGLATEQDLGLPITAIAAVQSYGGDYNITGSFPASASVTIALYDPADKSPIALADATCEEIGTGFYIWDFSKLAAQPERYPNREYYYEMTDGSTTIRGVYRYNRTDELLSEIQRGRRETDPVTGLQTIYNTAGDPILRGAIWENIAGTIPYQGDGINRADRLDDV